jgi:hypothetical protein
MFRSILNKFVKDSSMLVIYPKNSSTDRVSPYTLLVIPSVSLSIERAALI